MAFAAADEAEAAPPPAANPGESIHVQFAAEALASGKENETPRVGEDIHVSFRITDAQSGFGISELHPAAWITPRERDTDAPDRVACEQRIRELAQLGVTRADEDLNGFYILTLNADDTLAVLNPVINLNTSNLKTLIPIKGRTAQWDFDDRTALVYVTMPDDGQVAVVDVRQGRVLHYLTVGEVPGRVRVQTDGRYTWVGNDESGTASVLSSDGASVAATIEVGTGPIDFAFDARGRFAFVAAEGASAVSVVDVAALKVLRRIEIPGGIRSLAYSELSTALYVLHGDGNAISALYPDTSTAPQTIGLPVAASTIAASNDGAWVLALGSESNEVIALDTSVDRVRRSMRLAEEPTGVAFSSVFAYVHHARSSNLTVIQLSGLDDPETPPVVMIPMGLERPEDKIGRAGVLPMDLLPEEGGAVVANPIEKVLYFYTDGMMSPMGSFKTYTANPVGVILYDRSLQERGTSGLYETSVRIDKPGTYDVPFVLSSPKVVTCFELTVDGDAEADDTPAPPVVKPQFAGTTFEAGQVSRLRFEVHDATSGSPMSDIEDVRVLATKLGRNWAVRPYAKALGDGIYEVEVVFPDAGQYNVLFEASSLGVRFGDLQQAYASVEETDDEEVR